MGQTVLGIHGERLTINGRLTYSDIPGTKPESHGLLFNARFVQALFDDKSEPQRFSRFGRSWDRDANTSALIEALPQWKRYGLLGFTVGLQGGMPVLTIDNSTIDNNPYSADGKIIDRGYLERLDRIVRAADDLGMIVIVSLLYEGQVNRMADGRCIRNAVTGACNHLRSAGYTNIIIEVANEHDVGNFKNHPLVCSSQGISSLIDLARREADGIPVGSSSGGLTFYPEVCELSDIILVHGNGGTEQTYYNMIRDIKAAKYNKPIICNEDSPRFTQLKVALHTGTSWGYYNTHTKQEPPADWTVTPGEDRFFAQRMAQSIGIEVPEIPFADQFHLQGFEENCTFQNKRWIRLAALYPERIDYVEFYRNGTLFDVAWEEPYYVGHRQTWIQEGVTMMEKEEWKAVVHLHSGKTIETGNRPHSASLSG